MNPVEVVARIEERLRRSSADPVAFAQHAPSDITYLLGLIPPELRPAAPLREVRGRVQDLIEQRSDGGWYLKSAPRRDN